MNVKLLSLINELPCLGFIIVLGINKIPYIIGWGVCGHQNGRNVSVKSIPRPYVGS